MGPKKWLAVGGLVAAAVVVARYTPAAGAEVRSVPGPAPATLDLSAFAATPPGRPLDVAFLHHSCGGQLLAPVGADVSVPPASCVYTSHPNGGGLRALLEPQGYRIHEASYGSALGEHTDLFDWPPKLRASMDAILKLKNQDERLPEGQTNRVVAFKSCFPNNMFRAEGAAPGNPAGPELTVWNAKAALTTILPELRRHPDVLFVYLTAPPNAPRPEPVSLGRALLRRLRGRGSASEELATSAALAREFNDWVASKSGWLADYPEKNVVVFDYYDILTGGRRSNLSVYATDDAQDSHPSAEGNAKAAEAFASFLNRAVRRAGLASGASP